MNHLIVALAPFFDMVAPTSSVLVDHAGTVDTRDSKGKTALEVCIVFSNIVT